MLDALEFETAVAQANAIARLRAAVDLYRGELLPGCCDDWRLAMPEPWAYSLYQPAAAVAAALRQPFSPTKGNVVTAK